MQLCGSMLPHKLPDDGRRPKRMSDIFVYFDVNFNVFFKLIKVHLLVSELYIHQNTRCNDKKNIV